MSAGHKFGGHSHIRLPTTTERSFGREKHLGENLQKLAIPAGMSRELAKTAPVIKGRPGKSYAAASRPRRHIPGVTP